MGGAAGYVLDVDDLFFRLAKCVGFKVSHLLKPIAEISTDI